MPKPRNIDDWTNEQFVDDLMTHSPHGALCQAFIISAIEYYCDTVIDEKEKFLGEEEEARKAGKIMLVSRKAWVGIAEDIKSRIVRKYHFKV